MRKGLALLTSIALVATLFASIQPAVAVLPAFDPQTSKGIYFDGGSATNIQCAVNSAFDIGLQDFTFDWWQRAASTQVARWPRIFQFGQGDSNSDGMAVSEEEDGNIYLWLDGANPGNRSGNRLSAPLPTPSNDWVHIAVSRETDPITLTTTFSIFINGLPSGSSAFPYDITRNFSAPTQDLALYVGGANDSGAGTFTGEITGFELTMAVRWKAPFTPPTDYNSTVTDRVLLIYPTSDFTSTGLTNLLDSNSLTRNIQFNGVTYGNPNAAPAPTPSDSPSPSPTPTPGPSDSPSPSPTPTPSGSPSPSDSPTPSPTESPSPDPTPPPPPVSYVAETGFTFNSWVHIEGLPDYSSVNRIEINVPYGDSQVCVAVPAPNNGIRLFSDIPSRLDFLLPSIDDVKTKCNDYFQNESSAGYISLDVWLLDQDGNLVDSLTADVLIPPIVTHVENMDTEKNSRNSFNTGDNLRLTVKNLRNVIASKFIIFGYEFDGGECWRTSRLRQDLDFPFLVENIDDADHLKLQIPDYRALLDCEYSFNSTLNESYIFDPFLPHQLLVELTDSSGESEGGMMLMLPPAIEFNKVDLRPHAASVVSRDYRTVLGNQPFRIESSDSATPNNYEAVTYLGAETTYTHLGVPTLCSISPDRLSSNHFLHFDFFAHDKLEFWFPANSEQFRALCPGFAQEDEPGGILEFTLSMWTGENDHLHFFESITAHMAIPPLIELPDSRVDVNLGDSQNFRVSNKVSARTLWFTVYGDEFAGGSCAFYFPLIDGWLLDSNFVTSDGFVSIHFPNATSINNECESLFINDSKRFIQSRDHLGRVEFGDRNYESVSILFIHYLAIAEEAPPTPVSPPTPPTPAPPSSLQQVEVPAVTNVPPPTPAEVVKVVAATEVVTPSAEPDPQPESIRVSVPTDVNKEVPLVVAPMQAAPKAKDLTWCTRLGIWIFTKSGLLRVCNPQKKIAIETIACAGRDKNPTFPWVFKVQRLAKAPIKSKSGEILYNAIFFFKGLSISGVSRVDSKPCTNGSVFIPISQSKILYQFAKLYKPIIWVQAK